MICHTQYFSTFPSRASSLFRQTTYLVGGLHLLGGNEQLILGQDGEALDLGLDGAGVTDGLDDVAGAGLALGPEHGGTLGDAAEGLAEISASADEGDVELGLVGVVDLVGHGQNLGLVDVVDLARLEDLRFDEVADAGLGHDGDGDGVLDLEDHGGVRHASDSAVAADVGGDALEGHDGDGTGRLGDLGLLDVHDVHDHTALEHLGESLLDGVGADLGGAVAVSVSVSISVRSGHY
mmetsp:Transcript_10204/g.28622  ORF Transcript_10204/g.28622 Transcript_10204/m.28622 type:complete len:236 (+) Transcript_10204:170-877(+)